MAVTHASPDSKVVAALTACLQVALALVFGDTTRSGCVLPRERGALWGRLGNDRPGSEGA